MSQTLKKEETSSDSSSTTIPTAVIVCNGPSLADVPLYWLESHVTFGANRVYLREDFQSTFYTAIDVLMTSTPELRAEVIEYGSKSNMAFVNKEMGGEWPNNFIETNCITPYDDDGNYVREFSLEPIKVVVEGGSVTYANIQFAHWLGYRRLYLVGLDHTSGPHFHPEYSDPFPEKSFSEEQYQEITEFYYEKANEVFEGEIYNLTPGSQLDVFTNRSDRLQWPKSSRRSKRVAG